MKLFDFDFCLLDSHEDSLPNVDAPPELPLEYRISRDQSSRISAASF